MYLQHGPTSPFANIIIAFITKIAATGNACASSKPLGFLVSSRDSIALYRLLLPAPPINIDSRNPIVNSEAISFASSSKLSSPRAIASRITSTNEFNVLTNIPSRILIMPLIAVSLRNSGITALKTIPIRSRN